MTENVAIIGCYFAEPELYNTTPWFTKFDDNFQESIEYLTRYRLIEDIILSNKTCPVTPLLLQVIDNTDTIIQAPRGTARRQKLIATLPYQNAQVTNQSQHEANC